MSSADSLDTPPGMTYVRRMTNVSHLGTTEAADALGIKPRTLTRWVKAGRIVPVTKLPGLRGGYVFTAAEVERVKSERVA